MNMAKGTIPIMSIRDTGYGGWLIFLTLVALMVGIVWLAPAEKTLGDTIRLVYVHVAFTRSGMMGFYTAGILGLMIALTNNKRLQSLTQTIAWVAFVLFVIGGLFSVFAQQASWGGQLLAEPRNRTSLSIVAVAVIILIVNMGIPWIRVRGLLYALLAGYVAWIIPRTPVVLHPSDAVSSSPSVWFRITFPVLTVIAFLLGIWVVWYYERSKVT